MKKDMIKRKSIEEFRSTGLLLFVNSFLHIFGWAIVVTTENDTAVELFPARVGFRGFDEKATSESYSKLSKYMAENGPELQKECDDESRD